MASNITTTMKDFGINLLFLHDKDINYDCYGTATQFAIEWGYDKSLYSIEKIIFNSEDGYNGFMKALEIFNPATGFLDRRIKNMLVISDDEYNQIIAVNMKNK